MVIMILQLLIMMIYSMIIKKKNAHFGRYPSCDMLNNVIRFILENKPNIALKEIVHAIFEADGYFY